MGILRENKERYWVEAKPAVVTVWRRPLANISKLSAAARKRNIQTQIISQDLPVKVLKEKGDFLFIQMADLTRGFVEAKSMRRLPTKKYWRSVKRFGKKLVPLQMSSAQFVSRMKRWPRIRYVWGGRSRKGMDCSACIQEVVWRVSGYLLPRNSRDQSKKGQPVSRLAVGDIVYFKGRQDSVGHIGLVADECRGDVFHLSRLKKVPVFEKLEDMQKRYRVIDIRRLFKFND